MRPLKLRIEGFGAYIQPQEISFDDIELFAITGQTGAGKSTLLDAITFALYKATPRLGSRDFRELKHPAAESAKVELTFALGEESWRVVRVVGRENQNRLEYLRQGQWKTHPSSEKARELDGKLAEILGMDYETFTRAILLPQGQFDLFLRGSPKERRETLIKLYGLESLQAMQERASTHQKSLKEEIQRLEGELSALAEAREDRVAALEEELKKLAQEAGVLERRRQQEEKELRALEERYQQHLELARLRRRREQWEKERPHMQEVAARLERHDRAERIWPHWEALEKSQSELEQAHAQLEGEKEKLGALEARYHTLGRGFDPGRLEELKERLNQLPLLQSQEAWLKRYGGHLNLEHPSPLPFDEERLELLHNAERQIAELSRQQEWHRRAQKALDEAQAELQKAQEEASALEKELEHLKAEGIAAKAAKEQAEAALEQERARQGLQAFRSHLHLGQPCPLCEQPLVQLPPPRALADLALLEADLKARTQALEELRAEYRAKQERHKQLLESLPRLNQRLSQRRQEEAEARAELATLQARLEGLGPVEALREEQNRRLAALAQAIRAATGGLPVAAYAANLRQQHQTLEAQARQLAELEAQLKEAQALSLRQEERVRVLEEAFTRQEATLQTLLQEARFASPQALKQALLHPSEVQALRQRKEQHEREGVEIESQLERFKNIRQEEPVSEAQLAEKKAQLHTLQRALSEVQQRLGRAQTRLESLQMQLERQRALEKRKAALEKEHDLWQTLAQDLRSDRFPAFLLERYQASLLQRASALIQALSHQRYSLHLEEGEYKVLDRWTQASRPVRTLSGGESFMASLSLALSLSEHLSRGRIGALFLDEGFGTLDGETLEQVAGVLEALPTQGRLVGIVTHVEALAERLPARLLVEKSPAGSRVRWQD
ncbi:AAA family ATPase [Meiothermus rufus]|uniref:AAA family ATPase n=1 Tax=Meiothermus rufus TaxID=604332 RepID=UPI000406D5BA|nr:SMC family ATPase [Meiothermus rufus]